MSYRKFVFDTKKRKFLGRFEEMYRAEDGEEKFDSWHESDLKCLRKSISRLILDSYNFKNILDIGCGKGRFTHLLKKRNNHITGIDISATAISKAKASYPDIEFHCMDIRNILQLNNKFDLIIAMGVFAYIKEWRRILRDIAPLTNYAYFAEYVPKKPIGFVKDINSFTREVKKSFTIIEKVILNEEHCMLFSESKK